MVKPSSGCAASSRVRATTRSVCGEDRGTVEHVLLGSYRPFMLPGEIDLLNRDIFVDGPPHDWFTWLRNNEPVYRHAEPDGPGFWVLTKYDDIVAINRNAKTFSSDQRKGGVV